MWGKGKQFYKAPFTRFAKDNDTTFHSLQACSLFPDEVEFRSWVSFLYVSNEAIRCISDLMTYFGAAILTSYYVLEQVPSTFSTLEIVLLLWFGSLFLNELAQVFVAIGNIFWIYSCFRSINRHLLTWIRHYNLSTVAILILKQLRLSFVLTV